MQSLFDIIVSLLLILVIPLAISQLKLKTFTRLAVSAHKSNSILLLRRKASWFETSINENGFRDRLI